MSSRVREYNHTRSCVECGRVFHASRYDADYCGSTCRSRASRKRKLDAAKFDKMKAAIRDYLKMYTYNDAAYRYALREVATFVHGQTRG